MATTCPELFDHTDEFRAYSKQLIDSGALPSNVQDTVDALLAFLVPKAHTTFCAALELIRHGFAIDAVMQIRNLVEVVINLRFIP